MQTHVEDAAPGSASTDAPQRAEVLLCGAAAAATLVLALLAIRFARVGADWPAQDFRAYLAQHGLPVWTNNWYGGSPLIGYSVLYPPLAAISGSSVIAVASVVVAAWFAAQLGPRRRPWAQVAFCAAVALCLLEALVIGQVTFLLGVAFATPALVALRAQRRWWTALCAAASSLASPLAGLFLIFVGVAVLRSYGWRRAALLSPAIFGSAVAAVVDSGGGPFTYRVTTLGAITAFCLVILVLTDRRDRLLRDFALLLLVAALAGFVVANPVGANLSRLPRFVGPPLAVLYLVTRSLPMWRRRGALVALGLAVWWSLIPASSAIQFGAHDPGRHLAYYRGLLGFLRTQNPADGRLEIPFTRTHSETWWVARSFPLARGWERQVDLGANKVLYSPLTAASYRHWLDDNAVSLVALSTLLPDIGGKPEADLLRDPPAYLRPVWHDSHWTVWRVTDPQPIADGAARLTGLGPASLTLRFTQAGRSVVRVRSSPLWQVAGGRASLGRTHDGWLVVRSSRPGDVTLRARLSLALLDPTNDLR